MEEYIIPIFYGALCLLALAAAVRKIAGRFGPVRTARAEVVEKYTSTVFNSARGVHSKQYHILFLINGKKKGFLVSEFSYGGYRLHETGVLKYAGDRIIDFH